MDFKEYMQYMEDVVANPQQHPTYEDAEYYNYAKLNQSRSNRWLKKFEPTVAMKAAIDAIQEKQTWIVITEPWCGDAAHSVPQLYTLVKDNAHITFEVQLRDAEPYLIDHYLTNGGKSIPKLIIRDAIGADIAVWGPRPQALQDIFTEMKNEGKEFAAIKEMMQKWYNEDKGAALQQELIGLLKP
ncbi:thioredoxin family protein [Sphingobacterium sp. Mn56C]|uniref:thioredoxin family protein n=1 Tax=Sphingobacterium sp. Mn56C TaxID=3395261 RepID=UPI003BD87403